MEFLISFQFLQLPLWPFFILVLIYPAFLLIRNQLARNRYFRAEKNLKEISVRQPEAILFRCSMDEIRRIASLKKEKLRQWIQRKIQEELRWNIIALRFLPEEMFSMPAHSQAQNSQQQSHNLPVYPSL